MQTLSIRATIYALTALAAIAYAVCALFRQFFATWPMYNVALWQAFFPGFSWTLGGVLIGLAWAVAYAGIAGWLFASIYNFFAKRQISTTQDSGKHITT
jgi:hypothetical protein